MFEIITYIFVFVGSVLHCYIPLPDAVHPLHPWSDAPRSCRGTEILPLPWLQQDRWSRGEGSQSQSAVLVTLFAFEIQHKHTPQLFCWNSVCVSKVNTCWVRVSAPKNWGYWPHSLPEHHIYLFFSVLPSLLDSSVFWQDDYSVLLFSSSLPFSLPWLLFPES